MKGDKMIFKDRILSAEKARKAVDQKLFEELGTPVDLVDPAYSIWINHLQPMERYDLVVELRKEGKCNGSVEEQVEEAVTHIDSVLKECANV
tara:strand:- start:254832 stop:255107 length:276 start_codon:yes stop_codon:yes gene_type:complete